MFHVIKGNTKSVVTSPMKGPPGPLKTLGGPGLGFYKENYRSAESFSQSSMIENTTTNKADKMAKRAQ